MKFPLPDPKGISCCKTLLLSSALFIASFGIHAQQKIKANEKVFSGETSGFIENKGQIIDQNDHPNPGVLYLLNTTGLKIQLRKTGFSYDTYSIDERNSDKGKAPQLSFHRVDIELERMNPDVRIIAEQPSGSYFNYFRGNEGKAVAKVRDYQKVTYQNIYPQIDLVFKCENGKPEYDFVVHPGGDLKNIVLQYKGMNHLQQKSSTELIITVTKGSFGDFIPLSYELETEKKVQVSYSLNAENKVRFTANNYDTNNTLVIDPTPNLIWGSYIGGSNLDYGLAIALDPNDNVLVTGQTGSADNVATTGAYQNTYASGWECYVAKLKPDGTQLLWGTYYNGTNEGRSIASDGSGNVLVTGATGNTSVNLSTGGAFQTVYGGGGSDAYIAKFSADGTQLLWGTYLGGPEDDGGYSISADSHDNVVVTGYTRSYSGISSPGAYKTTSTATVPYFNAFVAKFSPAGQRLWSTYYGGGLNDQGIGITTDLNDNVLITGLTQSTGTATAGAYQTVLKGNSNTFVAKINSTGTQLLWSTYYGGTGSVTYPSGIALDNSGNVLIAGYTTSADFIATTGAYLTAYSGTMKTYVAKFNSDASQLLWGTYYGGSGTDAAYGIAVDGTGDVLITGSTTSTNNIATAGAYQSSYKSSNDTYVAKFSSNGTQLIWGTYFSVPYQDEGHGIAVDASGNALIAGFSGGYVGDADLSTPGSYKVGNSGYGDGYVAKFSNGGCVANAGVISASQESVCAGTPAHLMTSGHQGSIQWQSSPLSGGFTDISGATDTSLLIPIMQTTYFRVAANNGACSDTSEIFQLVVHPEPVPVVSALDTFICSSDSTQIHSSGPYSSYLWNTGDTLSSIYAKVAGGYWVTVTDANGCSAASNHQNISVHPVTPISIVVQGDTLSSFNGASYRWYRNDTLIPGATSAIYVAHETGYYSLEIIDDNGCIVRSTQVFVLITGLDELADNNLMGLFPNPANDFVIIRINLDHPEGELRFYDALGKLNFISDAKSEQTIRLENLAAGIYYFVYKSEDTFDTRKFIISAR